MTKYRVDLLERYIRIIEVEANSVDAAKEEAWNKAANLEGDLQFHSDGPREDWTVLNLDTQEFES